jgi:nucleoside-diphosphate-sugar epimerase
MSVAAEGAGAQRVAAVTGGAGAIGGAIVAALEASGHRVVVMDRNAEISLTRRRRGAVRPLRRAGSRRGSL